VYSDELMTVFKKNGIEIGDTIKVESGKESTEGELMPKTEMSADNVIIIKLQNGYNLGIVYDRGVSMKKLSKGSKGIEFPKAEIKSRKGLPKVVLIYTGGTIGAKVDYKTGGVHWFIEPAELLYEVPEISEIANIEVKQPFAISSEDMSYHEWQVIAEEVRKSLDGGADGIVVTTGTDTMHYIAAALSFMLQNLNAPVVVTGAQRSSDRGSSDAFMNLACAVQVAAHSDIAEVCICMHSSSSDERCAITRGTRVRKMHTARRDAFRPINNKPVAYVDRKLKIEYNGTYNKVAKEIGVKVEVKTGFEGKVALLKFHPNSDPEILDFYIRKGYKGIIIEGTGLGHIAVSTPHKELLWSGWIKRAIEKGMVIGMTSQCLYGRVNENVYRNLRIISGLGVVYCEDMMPETEYVKLGWLLGNYGKDEAKELLSKNIVGEISKRSEYGEFLV